MENELLSEIGEGRGFGRKLPMPEPGPNAGRIIGLGIDLVARDRVARMFETHGERFLQRCFTPGEIEYCLTRRDPIPDLAVRLAAKEAAFKAIGARRGMGLSWRDFEVVLDEGSVPSLRLLGQAARRGEETGVTEIRMSLTHEDLWVAAVIVMTGR